MNKLYDKLCKLIYEGDVLISEHGYTELAEDSLTAKEVISGIEKAKIIEEYPEYPKGPCLLLLQKDSCGNPIHAVWGIPKNQEKPAVLITAYKPDPLRWDKSFTRRL
ncbi:MAG: DUF4258 domain-containing protein [Kosmotogaceae bacterium]